MKSKLAFVILTVAVFCGAMFLTGCEDETATPTLTGDGGGGGGGGESTGLYLAEYAIPTELDIQVWSNTCDLTDGADGGTRVTALAVGWVGGSFAFHETGLDFSQVKSIKFKVRSNLPVNNIKYLLQVGTTNTVEKYLSASSGVTLVGTLNEITWTDVTIDVSSASALNVTSGFSFVFDPAPIAAGKWAEFKSIDWVDALGTSVSIKK